MRWNTNFYKIFRNVYFPLGIFKVAKSIYSPVSTPLFTFLAGPFNSGFYYQRFKDWWVELTSWKIKKHYCAHSNKTGFNLETLQRKKIKTIAFSKATFEERPTKVQANKVSWLKHLLFFLLLPCTSYICALLHASQCSLQYIFINLISSPSSAFFLLTVLQQISPTRNWESSFSGEFSQTS